MNLFIDIDGVIFDNNIINKPLLEFLKNNSVEYFICTGRGYLRTLDVLKDIIISNNPLVIENGSKLISIDGKIIKQISLTEHEIETISKLDFTQLEFALFVPNNSNEYIVYSMEQDIQNKIKYTNFITNDYNMFIEKLNEVGATQLTLKFNSEFNKNEFDEFVEVNSLQCRKSEDFYTLNSKGTTKKSAIEIIMEMYNIEKENSIVIGNDYNDLEMFSLNVNKKIVVINKDTPKELVSMGTDITSFEKLGELLTEIVGKYTKK